MPQPKLHASEAARQAAFRLRREQSRQAELAAKGLPALPRSPVCRAGRVGMPRLPVRRN